MVATLAAFLVALVLAVEAHTQEAEGYWLWSDVGPLVGWVWHEPGYWHESPNTGWYWCHWAYGTHVETSGPIWMPLCQPVAAG